MSGRVGRGRCPLSAPWMASPLRVSSVTTTSLRGRSGHDPHESAGDHLAAQRPLGQRCDADQGDGHHGLRGLVGAFLCVWSVRWIFGIQVS